MGRAKGSPPQGGRTSTVSTTRFRPQASRGVPLHPLRQLDQRPCDPPSVESSGSHVADQPGCHAPVAMSFARLYPVFRFILEALLTRRQSDVQLQAEVLALRHQLRVLQRQVRRPPRWQPTDRLFLSALSRLMPRASWSSLLPSPETLLRWAPGNGSPTLGSVPVAPALPAIRRPGRALRDHRYAWLGRTLAAASPHPRVPIGRLTR